MQEGILWGGSITSAWRWVPVNTVAKQGLEIRLATPLRKGFRFRDYPKASLGMLGARASEGLQPVAGLAGVGVVSLMWPDDFRGGQFRGRDAFWPCQGRLVVLFFVFERKRWQEAVWGCAPEAGGTRATAQRACC